MKNQVKNRAGSVISFFISCIASCFAFLIIMLVARNIDGITGSTSLIGYSTDTGVLSFFGETLEMPKGIVNGILGFPRASAMFVMELLPSCVSLVASELFSVLQDSFFALCDFVLSGLVDFLRLGI